ncbi:outer membrane protein assembly factor BamE [Futiania mangrovi]|uniref:Outer membrane protein assembly factor BamE n=1 Tax=Futiania mangrovi TaxID=2959716 RepID=A0A9J6PC16_9PROT|nr:outer membrane protein assembly factor BamE [Futiania mangrovii]MCP1336073.1 outer membrane protein assembly factor BamE [Futiania mangrovii]
MSRNRFGRTAALAAALTLAGTLGACAPIVDRHGYVQEGFDVESVRIGVDNRQSVQQKLGSPSTRGTFQSDVWYYISQEHQQRMFFTPKVTARQVVAVRFARNGLVSEIETLELEDGQEIALVERETPTRGRETTLLQEFFGNIGRFNDALRTGAMGDMIDRR